MSTDSKHRDMYRPALPIHGPHCPPDCRVCREGLLITQHAKPIVLHVLIPIVQSEVGP